MYTPNDTTKSIMDARIKKIFSVKHFNLNNFEDAVENGSFSHD